MKKDIFGFKTYGGHIFVAFEKTYQIVIFYYLLVVLYLLCLRLS